MMERQNQAQADTFLQGLQAASIEALQAISISLTDRSSAFVHTGLTLTLKPGLAFSLLLSAAMLQGFSILSKCFILLSVFGGHSSVHRQAVGN
jgi:hypothetical protein